MMVLETGNFNGFQNTTCAEQKRNDGRTQRSKESQPFPLGVDSLFKYRSRTHVSEDAQ